MLAARDQENLVHTRQTTAASKPLNQGVRQLQPKTPGHRAPKTPFKVLLHDENDPPQFGGRSGAKPQGGCKEKGVLAEKNAFVTPMGPRNRAPLGMKTTNARTRAFQTPAPNLDSANDILKAKKASTTRKPRASHVAPQPVSESPLSHESDEQYPEIEYMPPKGEPMPDLPEDIPYDTTFPQFSSDNMTRGWWDEYANQKGDDGLTDRERRDLKDREEHVKHVDMILQKAIDELEVPGYNVRAYPDEECLLEMEERLKSERQAISLAPTIKTRNSQMHSELHPRRRDPAPSTVRSRKAVSALSKPSIIVAASAQSAALSNASKSRLPILPFSGKRAPPPTNPSSMRQTAAASASRQTLGYSKGRNVSSSLRPSISGGGASKPLSNNPDFSNISVEEYVKHRGVPPVGSDMWFRCYDLGYYKDEASALKNKLEVDTLDTIFKAPVGEITGEEANDEDVFQLKFDGLGSD